MGLPEGVKAVEFTRKPLFLDGDSISLAVRFNYPDLSEPSGYQSIRMGLTVHAETRAELRKVLREAYEDKRPKALTKALVEEIEDEDSIEVM